jgi:hypothetical protein
MNIQVDAVHHLTRSQAFMASIVANDARGSSLDRWERLNMVLLIMLIVIAFVNNCYFY